MYVNSNQVTGIKSGVKPTQNVLIRILLCSFVNWL